MTLSISGEPIASWRMASLATGSGVDDADRREQFRRRTVGIFEELLSSWKKVQEVDFPLLHPFSLGQWLELRRSDRPTFFLNPSALTPLETERTATSVNEVANSILEFLKYGGESALVPWVSEVAGKAMGLELEELQQRFNFRNKDEISRFLELNPFLYRTLYEAREWIDEVFGPETPLVICFACDPEIPERKRLRCLVQTQLQPAQVFEKLKQIDEQWWLTVPYTVRRKMSIDVDFGWPSTGQIT